jgi:hypothetical protein
MCRAFGAIRGVTTADDDEHRISILYCSCRAQPASTDGATEHAAANPTHPAAQLY